MHKKKKGTGGGLCHWLAKKHHKSSSWEAKCKKKAKTGRRKHKRGRRRSVRYNPWAVCHNQGLRKGSRKFESCVQQVKAQNR